MKWTLTSSFVDDLIGEMFNEVRFDEVCTGVRDEWSFAIDGNVGGVRIFVDAVPLSNDGYVYWCCCNNEGA